MTHQELEAIKSALKAQIDYSTHFIQGVVTAQLVIVDAMLKSGAIDRGVLTEKVKTAIAHLTDESRATAFPNALTQLAELLELTIESQKISAADAASAEVARLLDRLKRQ